MKTIQIPVKLYKKAPPGKYSLIPSHGPGGTIVPPSTVYGDWHAPQRFDVTPDAGYHIHQLIIDNSIHVIYDNWTFYLIQEHHTIHADFQKEMELIWNYRIQASKRRGYNFTPYLWGDDDQQNFVAKGWLEPGQKFTLTDWTISSWTPNLLGVMGSGNSDLEVSISIIPDDPLFNPTEGKAYSVTYTAEGIDNIPELFDGIYQPGGRSYVNPPNQNMAYYIIPFEQTTDLNSFSNAPTFIKGQKTAFICACVPTFEPSNPLLHHIEGLNSPGGEVDNVGVIYRIEWAIKNTGNVTSEFMMKGTFSRQAPDLQSEYTSLPWEFQNYCQNYAGQTDPKFMYSINE